MRWSLASCLFVVAIAISACTPASWLPPVSNSRITNVESSEHFTHTSLWKERMVFGGVSSVTEAWSVERRAALSRTATVELESLKRLIRLKSVDYFTTRVGENNFHAINQMFRHDGKLDKETLIKISDRFPDTRYLFLTRITSDHSKSWENEVPEYEDGKLEEVYIYYYAEREAVAEGIIYDLQGSVAVWSGVVHSRLSRSHDSERHLDKSFGDQLAESLTSGGMPEMPTDEEVMADIHSRFSKSLPKAHACRGSDGGWLECMKLRQAMRVEWNQTSQTRSVEGAGAGNRVAEN